MELLIKMGNIPMLIITLIACLGGGIVRTWFNKNKTDSTFDIHIYNVVLSLAAAVGILILNGGIGEISTFTVLLALLFGVITALGSIINSTALTCGPWTYTSMFVSLSTIIPTLSGVLIFGEDPLVVWQYIGIVLLLVCFVMSTDKKKTAGEENKASTKWFVLCILLFLTTGCIGIMQKWHQSSELHKGELGAFLIIAFIISALFSTVNAFIYRKKSPSKVKWNAPMILIAALAGIFAAFNNQINLYLSGKISAVVFFPVVNGGGLILTALVSVIFFKEKMSLKRWIGLGIGALALVFICLLPEIC